MDPLSTATTFANIVSLIAGFLAERRSSGAASYDEFMKWLTINNHNELLRLLNQNGATVVSIKALLNRNNDELALRLQALDSSIAQLASGFEQFRDIALAIYPHADLSTQALSMLEQFVRSGASKMVAVEYMDLAMSLQYLDGPGGKLSYTEPRFVEDDLTTLVKLGFLRQISNGAGGYIYAVTRNAVRYVDALRNDT